MFALGIIHYYGKLDVTWTNTLLPIQQIILHSIVPFSQSLTQVLFLNFVPLPHVTEHSLQFDHGPTKSMIQLGYDYIICLRMHLKI